MAIEIVDLPINSMVIFHSYVNVYQRVTGKMMKKNLGFWGMMKIMTLGAFYAPDEKLATSKMPLAKKRTCRKGAIGVKISRISKG
jgi:hypothetical protein